MRPRALKLGLLVFQALWMLVVLPGHVRGMIALGDRCPAGATAGTMAGMKAVRDCCAADTKTDAKRTDAESSDGPSPERQSRCAVCNNAHGYTVPPVYDFDLAPTGFCELCRLIEPTRRHLLVCRPTYFATAPPAHSADHV